MHQFLPQDWLKYNTDAAKQRNNGNTAISYYCRNATGMMLAKNTESIGVTIIIIVEVLVIQEALITQEKSRLGELL